LCSVFRQAAWANRLRGIILVKTDMNPLLIGILGLLTFSVAAALLRERAVSNASRETYGALVATTSRDRVAVVGCLVTSLVVFAGTRYLFALSQTAEASLFIGFLTLWLATLL